MHNLTAFIIVGLAFTSAQSLSATSQRRAPWEWTVEERIRDRSDPVKAQERVAAARASDSFVGHIRTSSTSGSPQGDVIDGRRNPELFLPFELFRIFVSAAFTEDPTGRSVYRDGCIQDSTIPLPSNFWIRLEQITSTYITTLNHARALNRQAGAAEGAERARLEQQSQEIQAKQCQRLAENLEAVRSAFGRRFFDRFLYEAVAPTAGIGLERPSTPAELLQLERGCR